MQAADASRDAARRAGITAPFRFDDVTASTNATAMRLANDGAEEWTLVVAGHQTDGRGRLGRTWISEPGEALLFSLVLRPRLEPERAGLITLLAGVAMAEAARVACGAEVRCKWPNDLLVGEGKVGGILAEARLEGRSVLYVVLGVGVNVGAAPAIAGAAPLGGADPSTLLHAFLMCFRQRYGPQAPDFASEVTDAYRAVSATLGERVAATTLDGTEVEGLALDVDEAGNLLVRTDAGVARVGFGEIRHLPA